MVKKGFVPGVVPSPIWKVSSSSPPASSCTPIQKSVSEAVGELKVIDGSLPIVPVRRRLPLKSKRSDADTQERSAFGETEPLSNERKASSVSAVALSELILKV